MNKSECRFPISFLSRNQVESVVEGAEILTDDYIYLIAEKMGIEQQATFWADVERITNDVIKEFKADNEAKRRKHNEKE